MVAKSHKAAVDSLKIGGEFPAADHVRYVGRYVEDQMSILSASPMPDGLINLDAVITNGALDL
jgi:hypothetical protein